MGLRAGIGSSWIDIYRITHCQGTLLGLGSGSKGFAKRRRPIDNMVCSLCFFPIYTLKKRNYRPNSLSASTIITSNINA